MIAAEILDKSISQFQVILEHFNFNIIITIKFIVLFMKIILLIQIIFDIVQYICYFFMICAFLW